jgi:hypothetical protein
VKGGLGLSCPTQQQGASYEGKELFHQEAGKRYYLMSLRVKKRLQLLPYWRSVQGLRGDLVCIS